MNFKKRSIFFILIIGIIAIYTETFGADLYVDSELNGDCTSGEYSITNRNCSGSDGDAYNKIQEAINNCSVGDTIYMRGGTYNISYHGTSYAAGYYIRIEPSSKSGTAWTDGNFTTLKSYPGEWAVIDGKDSIGNSYPARGGIGYGDSTNADANDLAYWKFEKFEIKNCETKDNQRAAAFIINGGPIWYRFLYIHDNTAATGGNNPAGIRMQHMHDTIIEYCTFYNNGTDFYAKNSADICTITDYANNNTIAANGFIPSSSHVASRKNIIRYNLFLGGSIGFKYKGHQLLSGRGGRISDSYKNHGDKIHHNIFRNYGYGGIRCRIDFGQVYKNILDDGTWGISLGYGDPSSILYKICCYNNTITGTVARDGITNDNGIRRKYATNYSQGSTPYPVYGYDYNNIIDDCAASRDNDKSLAVGANSGGAALDLSNHYITKNYFYRPPESNIISLTHVTPVSSSNYFTLANFEGQTHTASLKVAYSNNLDAENLLYQGTSGADKYKIESSHTVESGVTAGNGGVGGSHPYLSGVELPSYLGAANPNDDAWVAGVLSLENIGVLMNSGACDPSWIEGGVGVIGIPPANPTGATGTLH